MVPTSEKPQIEKSVYDEQGYYVARGVFEPYQVEALKAHYMELRKDERPGDFAGVDLSSSDPLKKYPRMIHMHRWDEVSLRFLLDARLREAMTEMLGEEPLAVQTMLYFKPPGARGQALHQDNFYLRVQPGTCMAAWLALDACDEENGCMQVVPGSHRLPVLCTVPADTTQSFTDVTVPLAEGMGSVPVVMEPGDVLFFNGSLIHGSYPNTSADRFRRSLIGHYIVGDAQKVASYYHPVLRMDGSEVELGTSEGGGPCGVWVEREGETSVELRAPESPQNAPNHE